MTNNEHISKRDIFVKDIFLRDLYEKTKLFLDICDMDIINWGHNWERLQYHYSRVKQLQGSDFGQTADANHTKTMFWYNPTRCPPPIRV